MRSQVLSRKAQPEALNTTLERATATKESVYNRARMGGGRCRVPSFHRRAPSFAFSRILTKKREGTADEPRYWIIPEGSPGSPREPSI